MEQEKINNLLKMSAIDSIDRNMQTEDDMYKEDLEIHQKAVWEEGGEEGNSMNDSEPKKKNTEDEMRILSTGPVNVHYGDNTEQTETNTKQEPEVVTVEKEVIKKEYVPVETSQNGSLAKNLLAGGLAATGIGLGSAAAITAYNLSKPTTNVTLDDEDANWRFNVIKDEEVRGYVGGTPQP